MLVFFNILDMVSEIKKNGRAHYWVVHQGADPGYLEKAFISFKMMGFALLILSHSMK